jgi:hypothetical protein
MTNYNWIISLRRIIHATNCPATNCPATNRPCNELSVRRIVRRRIVLQRIVHATNCPQRIVRDELSCNELSGHRIPDGIFPYLKQDNSNFFPETENLGKRMDLTGNNRERPGNAPEIRRIQTDSSSKRIHLSDFNHIRKKKY